MNVSICLLLLFVLIQVVLLLRYLFLCARNCSQLVGHAKACFRFYLEVTGFAFCEVEVTDLAVCAGLEFIGCTACEDRLQTAIGATAQAGLL